MPDNVPSGPRIDRGALERIIRRAAELQADEREIGDSGMSESELVTLGQEVGIPQAYLQQALLEERTRSVVTVERGFLGWAVGPANVAAERTIAGEEHQVQAALGRWMTEEEMLQVKRRYPNRTSWDAQQGAIASIRRGLGLGGRRYVLARAHEIVGQVTTVQPGRCHVALIADVSPSRGARAGGAGAVLVVGAGATAVLSILPLAIPIIAALPIVVVLPLALAVGRGHLRFVHHMHVALEQVLDILEHRETDTGPHMRAPRASAFARIADEIRKSLNP
jgi:hypothetical protein